MPLNKSEKGQAKIKAAYSNRCSDEPWWDRPKSSSALIAGQATQDGQAVLQKAKQHLDSDDPAGPARTKQARAQRRHYEVGKQNNSACLSYDLK